MPVAENPISALARKDIAQVVSTVSFDTGITKAPFIPSKVPPDIPKNSFEFTLRRDDVRRIPTLDRLIPADAHHVDFSVYTTSARILVTDVELTEIKISAVDETNAYPKKVLSATSRLHTIPATGEVSYQFFSFRNFSGNGTPEDLLKADVTPSAGLIGLDLLLKDLRKEFGAREATFREKAKLTPLQIAFLNQVKFNAKSVSEGGGDYLLGGTFDEEDRLEELLLGISGVPGARERRYAVHAMRTNFTVRNTSRHQLLRRAVLSDPYNYENYENALATDTNLVLETAGARKILDRLPATMYDSELSTHTPSIVACMFSEFLKNRAGLPATTIEHILATSVTF